MPGDYLDQSETANGVVPVAGFLLDFQTLFCKEFVWILFYPLDPNLEPFPVQEAKVSIDQLVAPVDEALGRRDEMVSGARPLEAQKIHDTALLLKTNWDKLNKLHQDRLRWDQHSTSCPRIGWGETSTQQAAPG